MGSLIQLFDFISLTTVYNTRFAYNDFNEHRGMQAGLVWLDRRPGQCFRLEPIDEI